MTSGVPEECMGLSLDVQADIEKGEPGDVAESASALVRCVTASGGDMAMSRGMTVEHKKMGHGYHASGMRGYGYGATRMPKLEYGYKPHSAYGYGGGGMQRGYGYGSHRSYGYGKRGYGYGKRGYGYGRRYS